MSDAAQQLLEQVLRLSPGEREVLVKRVLSSLDLRPSTTSLSFEDEIARRVTSDDSTDVAWEDLRAETDALYGYE